VREKLTTGERTVEPAGPSSELLVVPFTLQGAGSNLSSRSAIDIGRSLTLEFPGFSGHRLASVDRRSDARIQRLEQGKGPPVV
jgi:hypothetical protein